jgi:hypothetical protein
MTVCWFVVLHQMFEAAVDMTIKKPVTAIRAPHTADTKNPGLLKRSLITPERIDRPTMNQTKSFTTPTKQAGPETAKVSARRETNATTVDAIPEVNLAFEIMIFPERAFSSH